MLWILFSSFGYKVLLFLRLLKLKSFEFLFKVLIINGIVFFIVNIVIFYIDIEEFSVILFKFVDRVMLSWW